MDQNQTKMFGWERTDEVNEFELNNFDLIARFYDELVSWAPYDLWVIVLLRHLQELGLEEGSRILDAACGSGLSTIPLARRGYRVTGIDRSQAMLELAREKAAAENLEVRLQTGDLLGLDIGESFRAVICMHSGLDYILELDNLQKAFFNLRRCLEPGGLFAFDKCLDEPDFYREPQRDRRTLQNAEALFEYSWDRKQRIFQQDCRIEFIDSSGAEKTVRMVQRMRAVPLGQLVKMVEKAGFKMLREPRQFTVTNPGMGIFRAV